MLKKKNIAMVMAAATVATSVAPVFAAEDIEQSELISKARKLFNTKYTDSAVTGIGDDDTDPYDGQDDDCKNSVYLIEAKVGDGQYIVVEDADELETLCEQASVDNEEVKVRVTDKGHRTEGSIIVAKTEKTKNTPYTQDMILNDIKEDKEKGIDSVMILDADGEKTDDSKEVAKAELQLRSGKTLTIVPGDYEFDFDKPLDADGNKIDLTSVDNNTLKNIASFELTEKNEKKIHDIPSKAVSLYAVGGLKTFEENLSRFLTSEGYTDEGEEFVNALMEATGEKQDDKAIYVYNGTKYYLRTGKEDLCSSVTYKNGSYQLTLRFQVEEKGDKKPTSVKMVIKSSNQKDLTRLKNDIQGSEEVVSGDITVLAGEDRFETAIEISKESFKDYNVTDNKDNAIVDGSDDCKGKQHANAVVLVGEDAIVDGLAAAPLATQQNAPILLTKAGKVPADTLAEIKRVIDEKETIYLIGGENVISKDVEKQLIKEMKANIVRLAGDDRYETSLEIADELLDENNENNKLEKATVGNAYVVGGDGEADAMSIAAIASAEDTRGPIIVTPEKGLTKNAKNLFGDLEGVEKVTAVGGTSKVSTQVLKDIDKEVGSDNAKVNRLAGDDRAETNAKVIKEYFGKDGKAGKDTKYVVVAKDGYVGGNGKLIDALAVAPFAAKAEAPIVLATEKLSENQHDNLEDAIKDYKNEDKDNKGVLIQAGKGIGANVIKTIADFLNI